MGLGLAQKMFSQPVSIADVSEAARETALTAGAAVAYDPADSTRRAIKDTGGGFDAIIDFAGSEASMNFAMSVLSRGGKVVVSGLIGGGFNIPVVNWVHRRMSIEGFMTGTLDEARELLALARTGEIKPPPMREEPMGDVQVWMDRLRTGEVTGRIILRND
jgi:D-arabinose 1-dehydrogenase-like Zn-dependent alcohol dehydrogenase